MNPFPALRLPAWVTPVSAAFFGSLLLTLIAHHNKSINFDGILYVHAALEFLDNGFDAAKKIFGWPFLPILMALVAKLTGLGPEYAGYLLNTLFMAGTCALLTKLYLQKIQQIINCLDSPPTEKIGGLSLIPTLTPFYLYINNISSLKTNH